MCVCDSDAEGETQSSDHRGEEGDMAKWRGEEGREKSVKVKSEMVKW